MAITLLASSQRGANNNTSLPKASNTNGGTMLSSASKNNGGLLGGAGYVGEKIALGALSSIEGIWDYTAGGIAKIFNYDEWAERQFANDWVNYNHADEWYNPSTGWKVAGDVAGGIGSSLPAIGGALLGAGAIALTGGAATPAAAGLITASISAGIAGLGAAGNATKEAYRETRELGAKEFGYGALSGATEAALEAVTAGLAKGSGRIVSEIGKKSASKLAADTAKETAQTMAKTGAKKIFKQLGEDFVTEAIEEGLSEILSPVYQRMTYNPEAQNATLQEVAYASLVGGLSGLVMTGSSIGVKSAVNTTDNFISGGKSAESGSYKSIIKQGKAIADGEAINDTGIEANQSVNETYNKLIESLKKNNGIASTEEVLKRIEEGNISFKANEKMLLGKLKKANTVATMFPYIERSAAGLMMNPEAAAEKFSAYGMKDANGNPITITAEDIVKGIDSELLAKFKAGTLTEKESVAFAKSYRKALSENPTLATLATAEATGQIMTSTKRIAESVLNGEMVASTADINKLIERGSLPEKQALAKALGVENVETLTATELGVRLAEYNANNGTSEWASQMKRIREAMNTSEDTAKPVPEQINKNMADGVYRFKDNAENFALFKEGETYHLYNYETGDISNPLTSKEVNSILKDVSKAEAQFDTDYSLNEEAQRIDELLRDKIPEYKSMSEPNKEALRMTMRQALAHGVSEDVALIATKVAQRSGLNVIFDAIEAQGDGALSGNTIYVNPKLSEQRVCEVVLGHEMFHKIFASGTKKAMKLYERAKALIEGGKTVKGTTVEDAVKDYISSEAKTEKLSEADAVREKYKAFYKKHKVDNATATAIAEEEVAAAGVEKVINSKEAWDYILGEEPSFATKVLSFFGKASQEYSSINSLSRQAKKFLRDYKKLFNEISASNQGNNALSLALEKAGVKKMPSNTAPYTRANADGKGGEKDIDEVVRYASDKYDAETANIREQLKNSQNTLNQMDIVFTGNVPVEFSSKTEAKQWADQELKKYGHQVDRQGMGVIEFSQKDIYGAIEHLKSGAEIAAIVAVPRVLKRGKQIGEHGNHKQREKHTVTFAAPVELNGIRGNMAVVVNMKNKKYYVHRVLLPDGTAFKFEQKNNAEQEMQRGVPKRSLANATSSASNTSISQKSEKSNPFDENSSKILNRREALSDKATKTVHGYTLNKSANVNEDLLEELSIHDPNAKVDRDGNITVYHRTSKENAAKIRKSGIMIAKEDALFFSSQKDGYASDYGNTVLTFNIPSTKLRVNDIFDGEVHFDMPLKRMSNGWSANVSAFLVDDMRFALPDTVEKDVLEKYGRTFGWNTAGYLLKNGTKLDLSGKTIGAPGGYRAVDHRDIFDIYEVDSYTDAMIEFMARGNIRVVPESPGINLIVEPTEAQYEQITSLVERLGWKEKEFHVDFDDENGTTIASLDYDGNVSARKVISDIKHFFKEGATPYQSELASFRFALTDYTQEQYNKSKETNTKGEIYEQNYKDSGILERGKISAVSGNGNNVRNQSYGTGKSDAGLEISSKKREVNAKRLLHTGISSGYLAKRTISTRYNYERLAESILRGWGGKLADTDANGRKLSQDIQDRFKNTILKNENGELLSVYHWTPNSFDIFAKGDVGFHFGTYDAALDRRKGKPESQIGLDIVKEAYLNIRNPIFLEDISTWDAVEISYQLWERGLISSIERNRLQHTRGANYGEYDDEASIAIRKVFKRLGYDGIIYQNAVEDKGTLSVMALYPDQIYTVAEESISNKRYALTDADIDEIFGDIGSDFDFDIDAILEKGAPINTKSVNLTVGQIKKDIANKTHYKVYSKKTALDVIGKIHGISSLTQKSMNEIADAVWQGFNECTDYQSRKDFASDISKYIVAKLITETKIENPDIVEAQERLSYLSTYIGSITFHPEYLSEIRHIADKKGLKSIIGRWGFKNRAGTRRVPLDVFTCDIAREMPGMSYLEEMHPAEALMELDSMYERDKATVKDKWLSAYWDTPDSEIAVMATSIEADIMKAFETEGEKSFFTKLVENKIEYYSNRAEFWKAERDNIKGRDRMHGLLMSVAQKMKDLRLGTFANSTQAESETFKNSIEKLSKIQFRGNLTTPDSTRKIFGELLKWYNTKNEVLEYVDENNSGYYVQSIADMLEYIASGDTGFSVQDLGIMYDVMSYFVKFVENYNKVFRNGKMVEALPLAKKYIEIAKGNEGLKTSLFAKLSATKYYAQMFNDPASIVRRMDYYEDGFYTETFEDLRDASADAEIAEMEVMRAYDEFLHNNKKYMQEASKQVVEYRGYKISKIQLIDLYMTMKRQQAWAGVALNGFVYKDLQGKRVRVPGFVKDENISQTSLKEAIEAEQKKIEKSFTDLDKQYMQILEKGYNEDARKLKADRDIQRLGFTNATTDYYYPIRRADIAKNIDTSDAKGEYDRVSNSSFNKDIVKGAKQKLSIESADSRYRRHIHAVCQYSYLSPAIEAYNRLYNMDISGNKNDPVSVRTATENIWKDGNAYFVKLISDIQGIPAGTTEGMGLLSFIRGSYAKFQLGANPKVWLTQLSSLFAASSVLDIDSITRGAFVSAEGVEQYCPLAALRKYDNTAAMAQAVLDKQGKEKGKIAKILSKTDKISDILMKPIGMMDNFTIHRLFGACQVQVEKNGGAKVGTDANKIEAGKLLKKVILETQQNALATERSAAMRHSNEVYRALTMFRSDAMKTIGRVIDAFGEISVLKARIKSTTDTNVKAELKTKLKAAQRKARKATMALMLGALFMASIAQLFRWIYDKEKDEDETIAETMVVDAVGNMLGGLPGFSDIYSALIEGYDIDNYTYSTVSDLVSSAKDVISLSENILDGSATAQDKALKIKKATYSVGQITGLPTRNLYNVFYGLTKRISPTTAYKIDNTFYKKNYQSDLYKAIEENDDRMANYIFSLLYNERMGDDLSESVRGELYSLSAKGYKVIPKSAPSKITIGESEYELNEQEIEAIRSRYSSAQSYIDKLISSAEYKKLSDEDKAEAVNNVFVICYDISLEDILGIDRGNKVLLSKAIGVNDLAMYQIATKGLLSDKDEGGNTISGSKRKKVVSAINTLKLTREQKLLLICSSGYAIKDGDIRGLKAESAKKLLLKYILSLKATKAEKEELAKICGFTVKNGKISLK